MEVTSSASRTSSTSYTLEHTWTIEDFSLHLTNNREMLDNNQSLPETNNPYAYLESSPFSPQYKSDLQFVLALYPRGNREINKDKLAVFLSLISGGEARCRFKISLLHPSGEILQTKTMTAILSDTNKIGYGTIFLESQHFFNKIQDNFPNDVLTIQCKIKVILGHSVAPVINLESIKNPSAISQLTADFSTLLDSGSFSDVCLILNQTQELSVHKSILSARSTVFRAMFTGNFLESRKNCVQIDDVNSGAFQAFLYFLYMGTAPELSLYAEELLQLSDQYDTASLKGLAEKYLASQLNSNSVLSILELADLHSAEHLKAKSLEYLVENVADIVKVTPASKMSQTLQQALQVPKVSDS